MRGLLLLLFSFPCLITFSQEKKICITIDDLPAVTYGSKIPGVENEIASKLIQTFKEFKIPACGYVVEGKLYHNGQLDAAKVGVLEMWLENGYDLGNHTFSHFDYNKVDDSLFFKDILKGQSITKPLMQKYGKVLKFFRHPYLHTGMDAVKSKSLQDFLSQNNYIQAPVTIDNDDYLFAKAYYNAFKKNNNLLMKEIGEEYVKYMELKLLYFEQKSEEVFNRKITQTLLIHSNQLNADYLDELAKMYEKNGYTFISQAETVNDSAYKTPINTYSKRGLSWIFRWGLSIGKGKSIMNHDIETPQSIIELATK